MYTRKIPFIDNGYYHVYNRGVDKRAVFLRFGHYLHFQQTIRSILSTGSATPRPLYNQSLALKSRMSILSYCLMPNHYHFLIKQTQYNGIPDFMHRLDTSYTKYFNMNNHRSGRLFESTFKAKMIESDEVLLHVSRYIHRNPVAKGLIKNPMEWRWSSYPEYFDPNIKPMCNHDEILGHFLSPDRYKIFVEETDMLSVSPTETEVEKDEDAQFL